MPKITTPIADFVNGYAEKKGIRLHMPGHKGKPFVGSEAFDITEIGGADVLSHAEGILLESERNASRLFHTAHTFYSTEGSSHTIKAMLSLIATRSGRQRPVILAARNVHKSFLYAAAWLDLEIVWLMPQTTASLCACPVTREDVKEALKQVSPDAVYLTSPDYLGNLQDIAGIAKELRARRIPLLVDNAHGAYLKFASPDRHPITLGATMCCDSAHKTLPVLTGGAYLHVAKGADPYFLDHAREALAAFGSTSPLYLTLLSLDLCNRYLTEEFSGKYNALQAPLTALSSALSACGMPNTAEEPLKLAIATQKGGISGDRLCEFLREHNVECEFSDRDALVLMLSTENTPEEVVKLGSLLSKAFSVLPHETDTAPTPPPFSLPPVRMTVRQAMLSRSETIPVKEALGRITAIPTVSCPPAIPITVSGEEITAEAI
ncbi:MAG: amino acid decarboxylase, partial [Clostridia bacterium]|nr:amino acid decarboxylase [Clostridia bacterium]